MQEEHFIFEQICPIVIGARDGPAELRSEWETQACSGRWNFKRPALTRPVQGEAGLGLGPLTSHFATDVTKIQAAASL